MNHHTVLFKNIRIISALAMIVTVAAGFVFSLSVVEGFIVSPILLLIEIGIFGYANFKLETNDESAEVHLFPTSKRVIKHSGQKAA